MDPDFIKGEYMKLVNNGKIFFTEMQVSWLRYRDLYKRYRGASTKEDRKKIRELIMKENFNKLA